MQAKLIEAEAQSIKWPSAELGTLRSDARNELEQLLLLIQALCPSG